MDNQQERVEAGIDKEKLLNWLTTGNVSFYSVLIADIKLGLFDINSLDRDEQLIAENEQLKNSVRYWQEDAKRSDEHGCRASAKVAEQDKEIQRLKRKIMILETDSALARLEEENPVRFKMDVNGNLTRIDES